MPGTARKIHESPLVDLPAHITLQVMIIHTLHSGQATSRSLRDQLLLNCSQDLAPVDSFTDYGVPVSVGTESVSPDAVSSALNPIQLQGLAEIIPQWSGDLTERAYNPHAFETVTNTDVAAAITHCTVKGFDEIIKAACVCSFLANRAVVNENPVAHQWFSEDQGYQQLDFDKVLRYYVQVASTGSGKSPSLPFYTQDPEKVIKTLASTFKTYYSEDYIRVVFYWLSRTWTSIVHPAVMEPSEANRTNTSPAAKSYLGNAKAIATQAQNDSAQADCMLLGIDWCQVGTVLKWVAITAGLGAAAYIVWEVSSVFKAKS